MIGAKGGIPALDSGTGLVVVGYGGANTTIATVTNLTNAPTAGDLTAAMKVSVSQTAVRERLNCSGTVWHVAYVASEPGDQSGNDGLSWATAYKTAGAYLPTAMAAMATGDAMLLGAGPFVVGTNQLNPTSGTQIIGAGMLATTISSTYNSTSHSIAVGLLMVLGTKTTVSDLSIIGTLAAPNYQSPIALNGTGISLYRCLLSASSDNIFAIATDCGLYVEDCILQTEYDSVYWNTATSMNAEFNRCRFYAIGKAAWASAVGGAYEISGLQASSNAGASSLYARDCHFTLLGVTGCTAYGVLVSAGASNVNLYDCTLDIAAGGGTASSVSNSGSGVVTLNNCSYDRSLPFNGLDKGALSNPALSTFMAKAPDNWIYGSAFKAGQVLPANWINAATVTGNPAVSVPQGNLGDAPQLLEATNSQIATTIPAWNAAPTLAKNGPYPSSITVQSNYDQSVWVLYRQAQ